MSRIFFYLLTLSLVAFLSACAAQSPNDVSDDTVEILPDNRPDANVLVLFLNRQTLLFNGDLAADRQSVTVARLKQMGCREPRLVREKAERQEGTWSFGRPRIVYISEWGCG